MGIHFSITGHSEPNNISGQISMPNLLKSGRRWVEWSVGSGVCCGTWAKGIEVDYIRNDIHLGELLRMWLAMHVTRGSNNERKSTFQ